MHIYLSGDTDIKKNTYMTNRNSKNASKFPCRQHHFIHPLGKKTKTQKLCLHQQKKQIKTLKKHGFWDLQQFTHNLL